MHNSVYAYACMHCIYSRKHARSRARVMAYACCKLQYMHATCAGMVCACK